MTDGNIKNELKEEIQKVILKEWNTKRDPSMPFPPSFIRKVEKISNIKVNLDENRSSILEVVGNAELKNYKPEAIISNEFKLRDDAPGPQVFNTQSFQHEESKTITTTTTNGFKIGTSTTTKAAFEAEVPLIGGAKAETSITLSGEYNWSMSKAVSKTEKISFTIPAQSITVYPGEKVTYCVSVLRGNIEANTLIKVPIDGEVDFTYSFEHHIVGTDAAPKKQRYKENLSTFIEEARCNFLTKNEDGEPFVIHNGKIDFTCAIKTETEIIREKMGEKEVIDRTVNVLI